MQSLNEKAVHWIFSQSLKFARLIDSPDGCAERRTTWMHTRSELGSDHEIVKSCFLEIIARPWFTRLWTLQEALLAKHKPVYAIGKYMSSELPRLWFDFSDQQSQAPDFDFSTGILSHMALSDIHDLRENVARARAGSEASDIHERARQERTEYKIAGLGQAIVRTQSEQEPTQWQSSGQAAPSHEGVGRARAAAARLVHIMKYTATRHASLPHDMIYGVLGLAFTQLPAHLTPNHDLPYTSVYQ